MRDLNPRTLSRLAVFETAPFSLLGNSPDANNSIAQNKTVSCYNMEWRGNAMTERKTSRRSRYLGQFTKGPDGAYIYEGDRYIPRNTEWKPVKRELCLYLAAAAVCVIAAGVIPSAGMIGAWYVILPYALAAVLLILLGIRMIQVTEDGGSVHAYTYEKTINWFGFYAVCITVCICAAMAGELACSLLTGQFTAWTAAAAGVYAVIILLMMRFRRRNASVQWEKQPGRKTEGK